MNSQNTERKFSTENWRIFDELREEQRKLQLFNDSKVFEDENELGSLNSLLVESNDDSLIDGNKIVVEKYCIDFSSSCADQSVANDDKLVANEECDDISPNRQLLLGISSGNNCLTHKNLFTKDTLAVLSVSENNDEICIPPALESLIHCLLNIKRFRKFLKGINREVLNKRNNMKEYPTILFFLEAYNLVKKRDDAMKCFKIRFQVNELTASLHDECPSSILMSMLELFHEELVECKIKEYLKHTCNQQCRFTSKQNHTAVSHLFRGHLKKKMQCECGHTKVVNEAFTTVTIPLAELEEKILFVKVVERKGSIILSTRLCFTINNWSTVGSLKEKIIFMKLVHISLESLVICLIDEARQPHILNDSLFLFELMVIDGEVCIFQTYNMLNNEASFNSSSSTCCNELTCKSELGPKSKSITQLFVHFYSSKFAIFYYILAVKFSSFCLGFDIYECIARLLDTSFTEFKISIKNENRLCIFCMTLQCSGCPLQYCDKIRISEQYYMVVFINSKLIIEEVDDKSITENQPLHIVSLNECLRSFTCIKENISCQACLQLSWKPSDTIVLKLPDVLIIQISNLYEHKLLYQNEILWPVSGKHSSSQMFSLSSLVVDDAEHSAFIKNKGSYEKILDEEVWIKHTMNDSLVVTSLPSTKIELLFYVKNHENVVKKPATQTSVLRKQKTNLSTDRITKENSLGYKSMRSVIASCGSYLYKRCYSQISSVCNCDRCKCLEQMHRKIIHSRSSLNTFVTVDVSAKDDAIEILKDNSFEKSENFYLVNMLHQAIRKQNLRNAVEHLNDQADVNYLHRGVAAIHLSAGIPSPLGCVFTQLCLDYGADPNLKSCDGMTPMHIATTGYQADIIKLLLKAGGSPDTKDLQDRSCYDILVQAKNQTGREHCEQLLRIFRGEENLDQKVETVEKFEQISLSHVMNRGLKKEDCFPSILPNVNNNFALNLSNTSGEDSCILHNDFSNTDFKESTVTEDDLQSLNSDVSFKQYQKRTWELLRFRKSKCCRNGSENISNGLIHRMLQWFGRIFGKR